MKIGYRKPSINKSISARTTAKWKRAAKRKIIPGYGKKGVGIYTNPKKYAYNRYYNKLTVGILPKKRYKRKNKTFWQTVDSWFVLIVFVLIVNLFESSERDNNTNKNENITTTSTTEETKVYDKDDCIINNILIQYCEIAEFPLDETELSHIKEQEKSYTQYWNGINDCVQLKMSGEYNSGHDLVLQLTTKANDNKLLYCVFRDFIVSIDNTIPIKEIENLWIELNTLNYKYSYYDFYELKIKYDEIKLLDSTQYDITIIYN